MKVFFPSLPGYLCTAWCRKQIVVVAQPQYIEGEIISSSIIKMIYYIKCNKLELQNHIFSFISMFFSHNFPNYLFCIYQYCIITWFSSADITSSSILDNFFLSSEWLLFYQCKTKQPMYYNSLF